MIEHIMESWFEWEDADLRTQLRRIRDIRRWRRDTLLMSAEDMEE